MSKPKLTGLYKLDDKLYRISPTADGGIKSEVFKKGDGFVSGGNIATIHWEGVRLSKSEADKLMS